MNLKHTTSNTKKNKKKMTTKNVYREINLHNYFIEKIKSYCGAV